MQYQKRPVDTTRTNVEGAYRYLELARRAGATFILASTSEVYGDPEVHPQPETYTGNIDPTGPRACYDVGKRCAETLSFDYERQYGVDIKVPRIFNTYGPRMRPDDGRVISNFVVQALREEPLTVYGDGSQTRSFCYVTDLVDGITELARQGPDVSGPINLGNDSEISIMQLAETVRDVVDTSASVTHEAQPTDDPQRRCPELTRARSVLDRWEPSVSLEEGLAATAECFRRVE